MAITMSKEHLSDFHAYEGTRVRVALALHLELTRKAAEGVLKGPRGTVSDEERGDAAAQIRLIEDLEDCLRFDPKAPRPAQHVAPPT